MGVCEFEQTIGIGSDALLGAVLSLTFGKPGKFFPVLEAPRMQRPDAANEIVARSNFLEMVRPTQVLLLSLSPDEKSGLASVLDGRIEAIEIDDIEAAVEYLSTSGRLAMGCDGGSMNPYIAQLLLGAELPGALSKLLASAAATAGHPVENGVVCSEPGLTMMALTAANYAWANGYAFRLLRESPDLIEQNIQELLARIDSANTGSPNRSEFERLVADLKTRLSKAVDGNLPWPQDIPLCFFTEGAPYGILFPRNAVGHVLGPLAGLMTAFSLAWVRLEGSMPPKPGLTAVVVDPQWSDITSETEEIGELLRSLPISIERVLESRATCQEIDLYIAHFPYDILYVSSHGQAPRYRWCQYDFIGTDGRKHQVETNEFEYFAREGAEISVTQKIYPLKVDGVAWADKEGLSKIDGGRVCQECLEQDPPKRLPTRFKWIQNERVEGIMLRDGVYFGPVQSLAGMRHPILVLNCCTTWPSLGTQIMLAGARACIATLWSVRDDSAVAYGVEVCRQILNHPIIRASLLGRCAVQSELCATAYVCFTWPHASIPRIDSSSDVPLDEFLANRLLRTLVGLLKLLPRSVSPKNVLRAANFVGTRLKELLEGRRGDLVDRDALEKTFDRLRQEKRNFSQEAYN